MLLSVKVRQADIAEICGVSRPLVSQWRTGKKRPSAPARRALEREYGIPAASWDLDPGAGAISPKPPRTPAQSTRAASPASPASSAITPGRPSTLDEVNERLRILGEIREHGLMPSEQMKLVDTETKLLAIKARLEKEIELYEDSAVKAAPFWRRVRGRIVEVLRPCPTCARALADALEEEGA